MTVQTLRTDGESELVVISRREYDALQARAGLDTAEEAMAERMVREARASREAGGDVALPGWLSSAILAGEHPIRAVRHHAGLTQDAVTTKAGISPRALDDAESGRASLDDTAVAAVAAALGVDPDWLSD